MDKLWFPLYFSSNKVNVPMIDAWLFKTTRNVNVPMIDAYLSKTTNFTCEPVFL